MQKKIAHILEGKEKHITETDIVLQPLPHKDFRFANPFIVLHHMKPQYIAPGEQEMRLHPHPHRGFAPVTFMLQGEGYHKDNAGHDMVVKAGDVQWMFAGRGILHSEGPTPEMLKKGGHYELIQLWINAPKANKADAPHYQHVTNAQQPAVLSAQGVDLRLASGQFDGQQGPIHTYTPIVSLCGTLTAGSTIQLPAKAGWWTLLYVAHGQVTVQNDTPVGAYHLVIFDKEGTDITVTATADAQLLFLSGEPIEEPLAVKDNFVMNTPEEIEQAISDAKTGQFGTLAY
ncbi:pirin family protein [Chitinophaga pendula]|uniref:pirin family protein n=1 Tax=Chitinophaga TaxID=79328 RepID=UPI000BAE8B77|nr:MULTISPECIES: pirin family protein [Chitinophaga]ASZ10175.1 hypothetical protein CK934_03850 [Chitinophaga sp. MD30]UCJ06870.1 pirin family protein [Chitinophaga pendula]